MLFEINLDTAPGSDDIVKYLETIYWVENWHQWQLSELDKNSLDMSPTECTPCHGRAAEIGGGGSSVVT